jgi:hypothetical protein
MRFMSIPPFERQIEIIDFDFFIRSRLNQAIVIWPEQAIALVVAVGARVTSRPPHGSVRAP